MIKKIMILIVVLFILGCTGQNKDSGPITDVDIYKGTEGLVMKFLENAPPDEIFEESLFGAGIELENRGAFNIENGYLSLGLEKDYMEIEEWPLKRPITGSASSSSVNFELLGKSLGRPIGDKYITSIRIKSKKLPDVLSEKHTSTILATACYMYRTSVFETTCIDTDIYNLKKQEKVCEIKDTILNDQGAPVAVTKIETNILNQENEKKVKPMFIIEIENKGNGIVLKGDDEIARKACSSEPMDYNEEYGKIRVRAYLSGNKQLVCEDAKLKEDKDSVRCTLEEGIGTGKGTYQAPLKILLDYSYTYTISRNTAIKKPNAET